MELLCPHCQSRLSIGDEFAGQLLKCATCSKMFHAPAAPAPPPAPPPPPAPAPAAPPPPLSATPPVQPAAGPVPTEAPPTVIPAPSAPPEPAPLPPLPSLDGYKRVYVVSFKRGVITWIAPVGLAVLLLLSFFPWSLSTSMTKRAERLSAVPANAEDLPKTMDQPKNTTDFLPHPFTPWGLAFASQPPMASFVLYLLFTFLTGILAVLAILLDKKLFILPEPLKKVRPYRSLIVAGLAAIGLLCLFSHWLYANFALINPTTLAFKIAIRVQLLVVIGALLDYWLQRRKKNELPIPKLEMRW